MGLKRETVEYVAQLARIELNSNELDKLSRQLQDILDFIDKLKKLDVESVKPTSHILPINNVLREDSLHKSMPLDKVLENAPERNGNFFVVSKVVE